MARAAKAYVMTRSTKDGKYTMFEVSHLASVRESGREFYAQFETVTPVRSAGRVAVTGNVRARSARLYVGENGVSYHVFSDNSANAVS